MISSFKLFNRLVLSMVFSSSFSWRPVNLTVRLSQLFRRSPCDCMQGPPLYQPAPGTRLSVCMSVWKSVYSCEKKSCWGWVSSRFLCSENSGCSNTAWSFDGLLCQMDRMTATVFRDYDESGGRTGASRRTVTSNSPKAVPHKLLSRSMLTVYHFLY